MGFKRMINSQVVDNIKKEKLFMENILTDIRDKKIFPAFRNGYVDFYYKGGKLFQFGKDGWKTHIKFASVLTLDKEYISEKDISETRPVKNFIEGYKRIKENCQLYSGVERSELSKLYNNMSYTDEKLNVVVLDIEVAFQSSSPPKGKKGPGRDIIDFVLYNKKTKTLRFYEAKHFSDSRLWSGVGTKPEVVAQIKRYNDQLEQKEKEILEAYRKYIDCANQLFDIKLPSDVSAIEKKVVLLIFGYDRDQFKGRFQTLLMNDKSLAGISHYEIGDIGKVKNESLWNA
jgi:hypothetical protein